MGDKKGKGEGKHREGRRAVGKGELPSAIWGVWIWQWRREGKEKGKLRS